jgi:hypothetical protein
MATSPLKSVLLSAAPQHILSALFFSLFILLTSPAIAETPLITYNRLHELLPNNNSDPLLTVYQNGKVRAVYPAFMKKAGTYEWTLLDVDMRELQRLAGNPSVQQFNKQAVEEKIEKKQQAQLTSISDSTTTVIDVKHITESGEAIESPTESIDSLQTISFEDVPDVSEENPEIVELKSLLTLESKLEAILKQATPEKLIK